MNFVDLKVRKDVNGQFQIALLLGDVNERMKILENCGQRSLAYLTARTHGLDEEADRIGEEAFGEGVEPPQTHENARLLQPPVPISQQESNWPLLSVSKGFFEGNIAARTATVSSAGTTGGVTSAISVLQAESVDISAAAGTWGDDADIVLDDDGEVVTRGRDDEEGGEDGADGGGAKGWDVEDEELDIPADLVAATAADTDDTGAESFFVAPTRGSSHAQLWCNNSKLAVDHILAGSFETAMRLLHDQVGIVEFGELRPIFLQTYARSRTCFSGLPSLAPLYAYPSRNPNSNNPKLCLPAVGLRMNDLVQRLQKAYEMTTNGKFAESAEAFRSILLSVPLLVVENKQEIAEAQQLIEVCREYIVGLSMELYRKELPKESIEDQKRSCEVNIIIFVNPLFISAF